MKSIRIRVQNNIFSANPYKIILLRDISELSIVYSTDFNAAVLNFMYNKNEPFSLNRSANLEEFNNFKQSWENFKKNEAYFFDLSNWEIK